MPAASTDLHRACIRLWQLAWPMILSNLTTPLLGLVDTAVVGHLDSAHYLAAVAVGSLMFSFIYWGFGFLRMGTTGITAQAVGCEDGHAIRLILGRAIILGVLLALLIMLAGPWLLPWALSLIDADTLVKQLASQYFEIRLLSAPATLANYALLGWFIGMQNSRIPLLILLAANLSNILLDIYFVIFAEMNVKGVALASVIAEYVALLLGLGLAFRLLKKHAGYWRWNELLDRQALLNLLRINSDIFIRTLCLISVFAVITVRGAQLGEIIVAANALLLNFQSLMAFALDGFAHAAEALCGKARGRRQQQDFMITVKAASHCSLVVAVGFSLFYAVTGQLLISLLTNLETVRAAAQQYLPWMIVAPLISVWSYLFDGIFVGTTRTTEMRNGMLVAVMLCYWPALYAFSGLGNHGLWLAFMLFMLVRGGILGWWFWQKPMA